MRIIVMIQGKILIKRHHKVEVGTRWWCFSASPTVDQTPKIDETKSLIKEWK